MHIYIYMLYTLLSRQFTPSFSSPSPSFSSYCSTAVPPAPYVLLSSLYRPLSRLVRRHSGLGPTEASWSSSPVSVPTGRSSVPPFFPSALLQGTHCRWPELHHQYPHVEPAPRRLLRCHGFCSKNSYICHPSVPPTGTASLFSPPPPHKRLPPSAPWTWNQPATTPSLLQCSLRYLSLMYFRIRFLAMV